MYTAFVRKKELILSPHRLCYAPSAFAATPTRAKLRMPSLLTLFIFFLHTAHGMYIRIPFRTEFDGGIIPRKTQFKYLVG